jgi:hypothetical protein
VRACKDQKVDPRQVLDNHNDPRPARRSTVKPNA